VKIRVIHGPNLNLLGQREPEIYGSETLTEVDASLAKAAADLGASVICSQHNGEGAIIDAIQDAGRAADGLLLNPGGYTHTSVAIRDAVSAITIPTIEIHLSNTYARESFRHRSLIAGVVKARVLGFGSESYTLGLRGLLKLLKSSS